MNDQTVEQINTTLLGGNNTATESQILLSLARSPMDRHRIKEHRSSMDRNTIKSRMKLQKTRIVRNTAHSQYQSMTGSAHASISKVDKKIS